jgi:hypothetical protein
MHLKLLAALALAATFCGCTHAEAEAPAKSKSPTTRPAATLPSSKVIDLFDGKTLKNWKSSEFGGEGAVEVEDGQIIVRSGSTLSGVNWVGLELPTENYEIELDAMKIEGSDFFLALTFPYKKDCASLIFGGWGGSMIGISSVNGFDAANNEYATAKEFKKKEWYHIRMRATPARIQAWISGQDDPVLDVETEGKEISTRSDIDAAKPLGLSTYQTSAAYKNIKLKKL